MKQDFFSNLSFVDVHYHADPDLYHRRYNYKKAGELYKKLNGAVVLKSHLGATSIQASMAQDEGLPVFPSLVLNHIAGGIHYKPILKAIAEYRPVIPSKMIVHFPTITGRAHQSRLSRQIIYPNMQDEICKAETLFDGNHKLKKEVAAICEMAADYPIVLSTGHASKEEIYALIDACIQYHVPALFLNQPANPMTNLTAKELLEISQQSFIWVEQTALTYLLGYQDENDFSSVLKEVKNVIYSSDLGQTSQMDLADWLKKSDEWFFKFNISNDRKVQLCLTNPLQLIKI